MPGFHISLFIPVGSGGFQTYLSFRTLPNGHWILGMDLVVPCYYKLRNPSILQILSLFLSLSHLNDGVPRRPQGPDLWRWRQLLLFSL